mgnify:CR=1 FL=1
MKKQSFKYFDDDPRKIVTDSFSGETLNYLWELAIKTNDLSLVWKRSYNELSHITKYTSSYRAQTDELVDIVIVQHDNYIILDASIVENGKEKVIKKINSTIYENDLQDLLIDIDDVLMDEWVNPYYNRYYDNEVYEPSVQKTSRKIKADNMLTNVEFDFNIEYLGVKND